MKQLFRRGLPLCLGAAVCFTACEPEEPCDDGYYEQRGSCIPEAPASGGSGGMTPGDAGPASDADPACDDPYAHLGDPCSTQEDCLCEPIVCNTAFGYCSRVGCAEDATLCPPDWDCVDITAFDPQAGSICVAP